MTFSFSKTLAAAAATGLLAVACGGATPEAQSADDVAAGEKEGCKGGGMDKEKCKAEESCEAKAECKAEESCKAKDGCEGHSPE